MPKKNRLYYLILSVAIVAVDQISKILIVNHLTEGQSVPIIGELLKFTFIFNEGGALGTSLGPSWLYAILTFLALIFIVRFFATSESGGVVINLSLALILGGALGNLVDRLRFGKVVDFIDVDIPDIKLLNLHRWYTFNIADAAITIGLLLFALSILIKRPAKETSSDSLPGPSAGEGDVGSS